MQTNTILLIVFISALTSVIAVAMTLGFVLTPSPQTSSVSPTPNILPTPTPPLLHFISPYIPIFSRTVGSSTPSTIYKLDAKNRIFAPVYSSLTDVYQVGGTLTVDQDYVLVAATKSIQLVNFRLAKLITTSYPPVSGLNISNIDVNFGGTMAIVTQNQNDNTYYRMPKATVALEMLSYPSVGRIWYGSLSKTADKAYLLTYDTTLPPLRLGVVNNFSTTPTPDTSSGVISLNLLTRVCSLLNTPMILSTNSQKMFVALQDESFNFGVVTMDLTVSPPTVVAENSWDLTGLVGGSTTVKGFAVSSDSLYAYFVTSVNPQCIAVNLQTGAVTMFGSGLPIAPVDMLVSNKTVFVLDEESATVNKGQMLMWDITTAYTYLTTQLFPTNAEGFCFGINSDVAAGFIA